MTLDADPCVRIGRLTVSVHREWRWGKPVHTTRHWLWAWCLGPLLVTYDARGPRSLRPTRLRPVGGRVSARASKTPPPAGGES